MVTFVSVNVCGLGEGKRRHLRSWLTAKDGGAAPDFLFLQETRVDANTLRDLQTSVLSNYSCLFAIPLDSHLVAGVGIAARKTDRIRSFTPTGSMRMAASSSRGQTSSA